MKSRKTYEERELLGFDAVENRRSSRASVCTPYITAVRGTSQLQIQLFAD
jgi:hypothetical protein